MRGFLEPTSDGGVKAPDNILLTVAAAYNQYINLKTNSTATNLEYAAIDGMIAGNPPYDQNELDANGLSHITNYNNFRGRANYEKSCLAYWNLINSTQVYVKIVLAGKSPEMPEYANTMARHYSDVTKEWPDFAPNFNLLGSQLVRYGKCPLIFPHEESPLWEVVDLSKFYLPPLTQSFMTKLSNCAVETTYTLQDLYVIYKNIANNEGGPWNKKAIADYLLFRANTIRGVGSNTDQQVFPDFVTLERALSNGDSLINQFYTDNVVLVNMYQKEYDNKISHYIFSADFYNSSTPNQWDGKNDFLYFVDRQYKSIEEAIIIFTASPGEWTIGGSIGVGQKMFAPMTAINMLECNTVDMAKMSSSPLVRSLATGGREMSAIRIYPGVFCDIGASEFVPNTLGANIEQIVGAAQYLTSGIDMNSINSGDDPSVPDRQQGSISASQAKSKDYKEFGSLKNSVAHFYNTFDKPVRISFIRMLELVHSKKEVAGHELAKEWYRRCIEDGVPEVLFDTANKGLNGLPRQFRSVRASRVAGDGSTLARIMGLESLNIIAPTFNERQMQAWKRNWVEATQGADYVQEFAGDEIGDETSGGASLAQQEDNSMSIGKPALFSADNDQPAHADKHLAACAEIVQAVSQQQMSPVDANKIMEKEIPHLTEHLQYMAKAPLFYKSTLDRVEEPYKQLLQWAKLNKANAEKMIAAALKKQQEDQAATQEVMTDAQRKDFVAQKDVARADYKVQQQVERAKEANVTRGTVMKEKVQSDADIKRLKTELDADVKRNATAIGREQTQLENTGINELSNELAGLTGSTPSTIDFEGA